MAPVALLRLLCRSRSPADLPVEEQVPSAGLHGSRGRSDHEHLGEATFRREDEEAQPRVELCPLPRPKRESGRPQRPDQGGEVLQRPRKPRRRPGRQDGRATLRPRSPGPLLPLSQREGRRHPGPLPGQGGKAHRSCERRPLPESSGEAEEKLLRPLPLLLHPLPPLPRLRRPFLPLPGDHPLGATGASHEEDSRGGFPPDPPGGRGRRDRPPDAGVSEDVPEASGVDGRSEREGAGASGLHRPPCQQHGQALTGGDHPERQPDPLGVDGFGERRPEEAQVLGAPPLGRVSGGQGACPIGSPEVLSRVHGPAGGEDPNRFGEDQHHGTRLPPRLRSRRLHRLHPGRRDRHLAKEEDGGGAPGLGGALPAPLRQRQRQYLHPPGRIHPFLQPRDLPDDRLHRAGAHLPSLHRVHPQRRPGDRRPLLEDRQGRRGRASPGQIR